MKKGRMSMTVSADANTETTEMVVSSDGAEIGYIRFNGRVKLKYHKELRLLAQIMCLIAEHDAE